MYNRFLGPRELAVKAGDRVAVQGYHGTVLEVHRGHRKEWNGTEYAPVPGGDWTSVTVHFDETEDVARFGQYQNGEYGDFKVL